MDNKYSKYLSINKYLLEELVNLLSKKYKYVSILGSDCNGSTYRVSSTTSSISDSTYNERGFVVRIHNGVNYAEYSFNNISKELIPVIINKIDEELKINSYLNDSKIISLKEYELINEEEIIKDFNKDNNPKELTNKEILDVLNDYVKYMMSKENVVNAQAILVRQNISKVFISNKKNMTQYYSWSNAMGMPIVFDGVKSNSYYDGVSGNNTIKVLEDLKNKLDELCKDANSLLSSSPIIPGVYDVITSPDITGLIAHEAFGHGVEMDMFVKGRAKAVEYMNKKVASEITTMHEGAKGNEEVSSYFFDDEGTLAHDTIEIKKGILKSGICDVISGLTLNFSPTGNGKRQSFERKAYTRMTSTYFEGGNDNLEDMIKSIKKGYLIKGMFSGMEDPKNWGIQCAAAIGKEIIDGKFTGKIVHPIIMTGYVPDLLNSISMASKEVELFGCGSCGKGHKERVKTADGGPYLKVRVNLG